MKLCIDCASHFSKCYDGEYGSDTYHYCKQGKQVDPVDGDVRYKECDKVRKGKCGSKGEFYEKKPDSVLLEELEEERMEAKKERIKGIVFLSVFVILFAGLAVLIVNC